MTRCLRILRPIVVACLFAFPLLTAAQPVELYVAPQGDDRAPGTAAQPVATIGRARDLIRALKKQGPLKAPVRVVLRGGTYFLNQTLLFTAEDSGTEACPITYTAAAGEQPVLSAGRPIGGWQPGTINGKACWVAPVPGVGPGKEYFRELFVGDATRPRSRLPREGFFRFAASNPKQEWRKPTASYKYVKGDLKNWANLGDVDLVMLNKWLDGHNAIARIDEAASTVFFPTVAALSVTDSKGLPERYYVLNVREAVTEPGQWYLDRPSGKLYYIPLAGETPERTVVVAPRLETLLRIEGTTQTQARGLRFEGLAFRHAESSVLNSPRQSAFNVPGAVLLRQAADCVFYGCSFTQIGAYAAQAGEGSVGNRFLACRFEDLGAGAVRIDLGSARTTVADCTIRRGGRMWHTAAGVLVMDSAQNRILHNEIADFFYTGVSCGWTWGYGHTHTWDNRIEYNHIHGLGQGLLDDMGGIYTLGSQPGSVIRGNVIHDVTNYQYGGWGIYTDEGSAYLLIEGNLVYRTQKGGFHQHYGRDNIVRNNIFALASEAELRRTRFERIVSFLFERNIVYQAPTSVLLDGKWDDGNYMMRENIFWVADGGDPEFAGHTLAQWQRMGCDARSIVADPLFADPDRGDFSLRPQSPALKRAFKPIDAAKAGPRRLDPRQTPLAQWPATEEAPRPIVEGRLDDVEFSQVRGKDRYAQTYTLKPGKPAEIVYHLWNCGPLPAEGDVIFRILPPEAARIEGEKMFHYKLKPDEKAVAHLKVIAPPKKPVLPCRLVAIPHEPGLFPSALNFAAPKKK